MTISFARWVQPAAILPLWFLLCTPLANAGLFDDLANSAEKLRQTAEEELSRARKTLEQEPDSRPKPPNKSQEAVAKESYPVNATNPPSPPDNLNRSRSHVAMVQRMLNELGYNVGPVDGAYGRNTGNGIRAYEDDNGLPVQGNVTDVLISRLNRDSEQARDRSPPTSAARMKESKQNLPVRSAETSDIRAVPVTTQPLEEAKLSAQAATTATTASAATQLDADGNEAVQTALFAWALGQHPDLAADKNLQWRSWGLEGLPGPAAPAKPGTGAEYEAYLRAVSDAAKTMPYPRKIRIEVPASLYDQPGGLRLSSQTEAIEGTPALARVYLQWREINALFEWVEQKPFFLPLPADLALPKREQRDSRVKDQMLLSIVIDMSNPAATVRGGVFRGVSAEARVEAVDLVHRIKRNKAGETVADPDLILANWTRQDSEPVALGSLVPVDLPELVALFGGAINADRYVPSSDTYSTFGKAIGVTRGRINSGEQTRSIETALAFGALLDAGSERTIGPEATQVALRYIVGEREAHEMFPVSYLTDYGNMNELQRRAALAEAEPRLRTLIAARMPQLPMKVRNVMWANLGEYDFTLKGFPIRASGGTWMPKSPVTGGDIVDLVPTFLPMHETEASQLLASVERKDELNRVLFIAVDYTVTEAMARPGKSGPIKPKELELVQLMNRIDTVTIYTDPELTIPVSVREYGANSAEAPKLLPDALFATTGKSLMGALGRLPGGRDMVLQTSASLRDVRWAAPDQRHRLAETITDEIVSASREEYWIGATWQLGAFDETIGGFAVKSVTFQAVPHEEDISGIGAPELEVDQPHDIEVLRIEPEQRAMIESYLDLTKASSMKGMRLSSYARVQPLSADQKRGQPILKISAPVELLLGAPGGYGRPQTDDHRVLLAAQPKLGPSGGAGPEITAPEALLLDYEGVDLLAISIAPEAYDSSAYERMLLERLLKERSLAQNPENAKNPVSLDWGRFFENPSAPLTKNDMTKLVTGFRDWTLARAAVLPETVLLPIGRRQHPLTNCQGLRLLTQPDIDMNEPFLKANTLALLGPDTVLNPRNNLYGSGRSRAGSDAVLYWKGGGRNGGSQSCKYVTSGLRSVDRGIQAENALFTSAIVVVKDQPNVSPTSEMPDSFMYRLSLDELRFMPASELNAPPEPLAGFLVLTANVEAAEAYRQNRFGGGYKTVGSIVKGDWDPLVAIAPADEDILGMTLEMPLAEFVTAARARMSKSALYKTVVPGKSMFGYATGLIEPSSGETLAAIYANHVEGKPVIALMRRLEMDASEVSMASLKLSLKEKYGPDFQEIREGELYWGALPAEEDTYGYCGGPSVFRRQNSQAVPEMETEDTDVFGDERKIQHNSFWSEFGWPSDFDRQRAGLIPDLAQCTSLIAVQINRNGRTLIFVTWLFDRELAERLDALPRAAVTRAKTDL